MQTGDQHYARRERKYFEDWRRSQGLIKLNETVVREIRALYKTGEYTYVGIAALLNDQGYNVKWITVAAVIARRNWKHVA